MRALPAWLAGAVLGRPAAGRVRRRPPVPADRQDWQPWRAPAAAAPRVAWIQDAALAASGLQVCSGIGSHPRLDRTGTPTAVPPVPEGPLSAPAAAFPRR